MMKKLTETKFEYGLSTKQIIELCVSDVAVHAIRLLAAFIKQISVSKEMYVLEAVRL